MTAPLDLDALEVLARAATPGEWAASAKQDAGSPSC